MELLDAVIEAIEDADELDRIVEPVDELVSRLTEDRGVKNVLTGTWLGHPLHPLLTDIPIGLWTGASFLDVFGGKDGARAARRLVGLGILAAIPTAATGESDWSDTYGADKRVGLVHGLLNSGAVALQVASYLARRRERRGRAFLLSATALGTVAFSGYLGGHLTFVRGIGVSRTAFEELPDDWVDTVRFDQLVDGDPTRVDADGVAVLLVRDGSTVLALSATCVHAGGALDEGELVDGCVRCPLHHSEFRLSDGRVLRGPASMDQPAWDTRVVDGTVSVRPRT